MPTKEQVGRLALREDGEWWKAYWAKPDTMDDAILLGQIKLGLIYGNVEVKRAFMLTMQQAMTFLINDKFGQKPVWPEPPIPAPEH